MIIIFEIQITCNQFHKIIELWYDKVSQSEHLRYKYFGIRYDKTKMVDIIEIWYDEINELR